MARRLFQVYDTVSQLCLGPIVPYGSDSPAVRMFFDLLGNGDTDPGKHPKDYTLLCVGVQDERSGAIVCESVQVVATGIVWLESQNRDVAQLSLLKQEA